MSSYGSTYVYVYVVEKACPSHFHTPHEGSSFHYTHNTPLPQYVQAALSRRENAGWAACSLRKARQKEGTLNASIVSPHSLGLDLGKNLCITAAAIQPRQRFTKLIYSCTIILASRTSTRAPIIKLIR